MKVLLTYKILKSKAFNESIDEGRIDWAIEMIEAGYELDNLYMLAGAVKPYNQFELEGLTDKVLQDFHLDYSDKETIVKNYIYYLVVKSVNHPEIYMNALRELRDICFSFATDPEYIDFYLLYWAKDDMRSAEVQWYWPDATRENIDQIIKEHFQKWLNDFEHKPTRANQ